jgi:hypothetical protein
MFALLSALSRSAALAALIVAVVAPPAKAAAPELPLRRTGLWDVVMVHAGRQSLDITAKHCTDPTVDRQMSAAALPVVKDICSRYDVQATASGIVIDMVCASGGLSITSHSEMSGDFQTSYVMKVTSQISGGPAGTPRDSSTTVTGTWRGACPADMAPGDIALPGGIRTNVKEAMPRGR